MNFKPLKWKQDWGYQNPNKLAEIDIREIGFYQAYRTHQANDGTYGVSNMSDGMFGFVQRGFKTVEAAMEFGEIKYAEHIKTYCEKLLSVVTE